MDKLVAPLERAGSRLFFPVVLVFSVAAASCGGGSGSDGGDGSNTATTSAVEVSWDRPEERENGDALRGGRIDHYELAYGTESGNYETFEETTNTSMTVEGLDKGEQYYFAVRAYDASGRVSTLSPEVSHTVR